jgi:PBP1b-binding outer membrane lipoprotein LpoB
MKHSILIVAGALALAGCGQAQKPAAENNTQAAPAAQTYSGTGRSTRPCADTFGRASRLLPC